MSIRKILVPLTGNNGDALALDAATYMANKLGARITGLHVRSSGDAALPFLGDTASGAVIEGIFDRIEAEAESLAKKAESAFRTWADKAALPGGVAPSYIEASGDRDGLLATHARRCDLIVVRGPAQSSVRDRNPRTAALRTFRANRAWLPWRPPRRSPARRPRLRFAVSDPSPGRRSPRLA